MPSHPRLELTADGSATLRSPLHGDTYHSLHGAVGESRHVFIEAGFIPAAATASASTANPVKILEMGFGTGLNAWFTLVEAAHSGRAVDYTAVELHPVAPEVAARLNYTADPRFAALHSAPWGVWTEPAERFRLQKLHSDFAVTKFSGTFDLVYWDAFAPDTQPELWTAAIFERVWQATVPGGIFVTYSSKGDVRRALQNAGFQVERIQGALGKRHMLRAKKV